MKILSIYGAMPSYDFGLMKALNIVHKTLKELSVSISEVSLSYEQIPCYDGIGSNAADKIIEEIKESNGIIFATSSSLFAPSSVLQSFLEYFGDISCKDILADKNCLILIVSKNGGERSSLDYLCKIVNYFGGFDTTKICIDAKDVENQYFKQIIEKQVEDYFRAVSQNRRFFIPNFLGKNITPEIEQKQSPTNELLATLTPEEKEILLELNTTKKPKTTITEVYKKLDLESFNERQEQDINDLTELFAKKYKEPQTQKSIEPLAQANNKEIALIPRIKTCRQATQSLPHKFQPQLSNGLNAVFQLNITGEEIFEGFITIVNTECTYEEGQTKTPDITIMASASVWADILKGKYTTQKAFMIGQLKVRGNFMLLTKFDQLFK